MGKLMKCSGKMSFFFSNQKLLCEDRFVGGVTMEVEVLEKQLLSQMLEAIRVTPSLHEDLQVEVMKVRPGDVWTRCFSPRQLVFLQKDCTLLLRARPVCSRPAIKPEDGCESGWQLRSSALQLFSLTVSFFLASVELSVMLHCVSVVLADLTNLCSTQRGLTFSRCFWLHRCYISCSLFPWVVKFVSPTQLKKKQHSSHVHSPPLISLSESEILCFPLQVLLCITYSPNFDINGDSILRIAEVGPPESVFGVEKPKILKDCKPALCLKFLLCAALNLYLMTKQTEASIDCMIAVLIGLSLTVSTGTESIALFITYKWTINWEHNRQNMSSFPP